MCHHKDYSPPHTEGREYSPKGLSTAGTAAGPEWHPYPFCGSGWPRPLGMVYRLSRCHRYRKTGSTRRDILPTGRLHRRSGAARRPRLVRLCPGSCLSEILKEEFVEGPTRVISGSLFHGTHAKGVCDYLGRYHTQITLLPEESPRVFLGWQRPGWDKFSRQASFCLRPAHQPPLCSQHGHQRFPQGDGSGGNF